jgi:glycosyltransferase involved in cell wall biosynthesis
VPQPRRPRLLVLNQYYWPGVEATANLLTELCEALAVDYDVTVVTGVLHDFEAEPRKLERHGVRIVRVRSLSYERSKLGPRGANYVSYVALALLHSLRGPRPDLVLCMTDPPFLGAVALAVARRFRAPLVVVSQDVFPEIAVAVGRLKNPLVVRALDRLVRFYLRRADRLVAIGETMRGRLESKGAAPERISVIPNWVNTDALAPAPRENAWAREHDLDGRFVIMHSGNVGHAQDLETLIHAAAYLRDLPDLSIEIVGRGAMRPKLEELAERLEARSVRFVDYQPRSVLAESLSAADVHVVGLAPGLAGFVVPSRTYGVMAVGRPLIVAADAESEIVALVEAAGAGVVVPAGRPDLLAAAIRDLHARRDDLASMGRRAREFVVANSDRAVAIGRYRALLDDLLRAGRGSGGSPD